MATSRSRRRASLPPSTSRQPPISRWPRRSIASRKGPGLESSRTSSRRPRQRLATVPRSTRPRSRLLGVRTRHSGSRWRRTGATSRYRAHRVATPTRCAPTPRSPRATARRSRRGASSRRAAKILATSPSRRPSSGWLRRSPFGRAKTPAPSARSSRRLISSSACPSRSSSTRSRQPGR